VIAYPTLHLRHAPSRAHTLDARSHVAAHAANQLLGLSGAHVHVQTHQSYEREGLLCSAVVKRCDKCLQDRRYLPFTRVAMFLVIHWRYKVAFEPVSPLHNSATQDIMGFAATYSGMPANVTLGQRTAVHK
jgi:hypothetical protein